MTHKWVDSHCHFDFAPFDNDREQHWQWLQSLGLQALVIPGVTRKQGAMLAQFCQSKPWFYAQGLHPYFLKEHQIEDLDWLNQQLNDDPNIIAVGEIGLDSILAKTEQQLKQQRQYFTSQVELATQHKKPLILHIRGMHDEAASFLKRKGFSYGGIVHAFSGSPQQAKNWLDLGFKLGIGGAMTHARATKLRSIVAELPLQAWLLETDSPDMASAFWHGQHHSPAAIPCLAAILAALHNTSLEEVSLIQKKNLLTIWTQLTDVLN